MTNYFSKLEPLGGIRGGVKRRAFRIRRGVGELRLICPVALDGISPVWEVGCGTSNLAQAPSYNPTFRHDFRRSLAQAASLDPSRWAPWL